MENSDLRMQNNELKMQNEELQRAILNRLPLGIVIHKPDTTIQFSNPEASRLLGLSEKQLQGLASYDPAWRFVRENGSPLPPEEYPVNLVLASLQAMQEYVLGIDRPVTGDRAWVSIRAYPEFGPNHELQHIVVTFTDITAAKRAENALRASGKMHRCLFETMSQGVVYQAADGHIISVNPAAERILGLSHDQILGKTSMDPDWKSVREDGSELPGQEHPAMVALRTGKPVERFIMGIMNPAKNKHTWISVSATPLFHQEETTPFQVYATIEDISAQRQAEAALRESEGTVRKKLQAILEPEGDIGTLSLSDIINPKELQAMMDDFNRITNIGIGIFDVNGKRLVATGWQDVCTNFHRVHPETLKNCQESDCILANGVASGTFKTYRCKNHMWDMVTPIIICGKHFGNVFFGQFFLEDEKIDYELFRRQAHQYGFDETEYLAAINRATRISREKTEAIMGFYAKLSEMISSLSYSKIILARTLSQKDIALSKLSESEKKLNALFTSMTEMVALHELVFNEQGEAINYRITDCNNAFCKITGINREDAVGKLASEVYQTKSAPYLREYSQVGISGKPYEYTTYYQPLGKHFAVSVVSPAQNRFATVTTDITAIKETEEVLSAKNKELENYLYVASHDLRSPLVNIQGFSLRLQKQADAITSILSDSILLPEKTLSLKAIVMEDMPKTLNFISSNVKKMDALLNGLLHVSRMGRSSMNIRKIDINNLFESIITAHNFQITEASAKVLIEKLPCCYGDENLLDQLFSNIIDNAIKYRDSSRQLTIEIKALSGFNKVVYSIRDNGIGIEQRHLDKIWTVFYQVDSVAPDSGEGLGLSVVKKIADKHRGKVWVESEPGKGSVFFIELSAAVFHDL